MASIGWKRWLGLTGAGLSSVVVTLVYFGFSSILSITSTAFGMEPPQNWHRILISAAVFLATLVASYRPIVAEQSCSIWWACWRAFLWAVVVSGILFQIGCLNSRMTLMNPKPYPSLEPLIVIFGLLWIIVFSSLAKDIVERKRFMQAT